MTNVLRIEARGSELEGKTTQYPVAVEPVVGTEPEYLTLKSMTQILRQAAYTVYR